eukprot:m.104564 g.104564  ORF g.104564 m.104564 type:complete len:806 (+) comp51601_c0_seq1:90-2507(+)
MAELAQESTPKPEGSTPPILLTRSSTSRLSSQQQDTSPKPATAEGNVGSLERKRSSGFGTIWRAPLVALGFKRASADASTPLSDSARTFPLPDSAPHSKVEEDLFSAALTQKRHRLDDERTLAYREDLAEWISGLYDLQVTEQNLMKELANGVLLCKLANYIQESENEYFAASGQPYTPRAPIRFKENAAAGTFLARDNISKMIQWTKTRGVQESVLFESEDLVNGKNEKNVLYCLMDVARKTIGMKKLPNLVEMEREIEQEEAAEREIEKEEAEEQKVPAGGDEGKRPEETEEHKPPTQVPHSDSPLQPHSDTAAGPRENDDNEGDEEEEATKKKTVTFGEDDEREYERDPSAEPGIRERMASEEYIIDKTPALSIDEVDKAVVRVSRQFDIPFRFKKLRPGLYMLGGRKIFVRILRMHVMVRVGGGWDTLLHYLTTHERQLQEFGEQVPGVSMQDISSALPNATEAAIRSVEELSAAAAAAKKKSWNAAPTENITGTLSSTSNTLTLTTTSSTGIHRSSSISKGSHRRVNSMDTGLVEISKADAAGVMSVQIKLSTPIRTPSGVLNTEHKSHSMDSTFNASTESLNASTQVVGTPSATSAPSPLVRTPSDSATKSLTPTQSLEAIPLPAQPHDSPVAQPSTPRPGTPQSAHTASSQSATPIPFSGSQPATSNTPASAAASPGSPQVQKSLSERRIRPALSGREPLQRSMTIANDPQPEAAAPGMRARAGSARLVRHSTIDSGSPSGSGTDVLAGKYAHIASRVDSGTRARVNSAVMTRPVGLAKRPSAGSGLQESDKPASSKP